MPVFADTDKDPNPCGTASFSGIDANSTTQNVPEADETVITEEDVTLPEEVFRIRKEVDNVFINLQHLFEQYSQLKNKYLCPLQSITIIITEIRQT